jgi:type II secretory pathway pseudopilin PulG
VDRGVSRYTDRDEGMTLLEVVMAIMIFFFVLTAIFGLLGATTNMSVFSKERTLLVNAMNSYIEDVRSMPYTSVGVDVTGAEVPGVLSQETSQTASGYAIVIRPTVTWVDDPDISPGTNDYKQITVDGTISRNGEVVYTLSMSTFIRQEAPPGDYTPPTITFGPGSPAESSPPPVVRGRTVLIDAIAETTMPGARLVSMSFQVSPGGIYLRDQGGSSALWELDATTATKQFYWDTMALNEDGDPFVTDGEYTITVEVVDSNQKRVYQTRRVLIDNDPPDPPSNLVANAALSGTQVPMTWTTSMDGRSQTDHYVLSVGVQSLGGTWVTEEVVTTGPTGQHTLSTQPFTRHYSRVAGESRDLLRSEWWPSAADPPDPPIFFVTRPLVSGTYQARFDNGNPKGWYVDVDLIVAPPTFPVASVRYELLEGTSPATLVPVTGQVNTTGTFDYQYYVAANNANQGVIDRYFQVRVYYQRTLFLSEQMLMSNILGPTSKTGSPAEISFPSPGVW